MIRRDANGGKVIEEKFARNLKNDVTEKDQWFYSYHIYYLVLYTRFRRKIGKIVDLILFNLIAVLGYLYTHYTSQTKNMIYLALPL